ncbi:MAG TPA: NUDIX domain-containing protein [Candidatus Dormibacteraeota bacterium]|nr:NUDIX domain-containing protein [Candidatus Dormibacteraeota bacterium]
MSNPRSGIEYIGVTCVFICHDGKGKILLHKRSQNCRDERGRWDSGAGELEYGEDFELAVEREILEEYGCQAENIRQLGVHNVIRNEEEGLTHWVAVVFSAQVDPAEVKIGEPHKMDEIGWFSPKDPPSPLHSQLKTYLNFLGDIDTLET